MATNLKKQKGTLELTKTKIKEKIT